MTEAYKIMKAYVEAHDIKGVNFIDEKNCCFMESHIAGNVDLHVVVIFDEGGKSISIRAFQYCEFPEEKKEAMYKVCSEMNADYRWVKFYVDEEDNTITVQDDAIISLDTCAEEALALVNFVFEIAGEAYPKFMKAVWA